MLSTNGICEIIGQYAIRALLYEVLTSPKPGLVDRYNQGAHNDMDIFTFMASLASLPYYFNRCARHGAQFNGHDLKKLFNCLRPIGIEAETAMFKATNNVNTHKGLVFSLGIICAAAAYGIRKGDYNQKAEGICRTVSDMTQGLCERELISITNNTGSTNGEKVFHNYGISGIRGEVENGFPTVLNKALPALRKLKKSGHFSINDMFAHTLLILMSENEDSCIAYRHNAAMIDYVQKRAGHALALGGMFSVDGLSEINAMEKDFIEKNISPGGSGDLLAVTIMLNLLDNMDKERSIEDDE